MELPGSVAQRRLSKELKAFRLALKLPRAKVCEELQIYQSTLSRIETNQQVPLRRTLVDLLRLYGVSADMRDMLMALRDRAASREGGGWLEPYIADLPPTYADYVGLEFDAATLLTWELAVVPGLLQTEDYARSVLAAVLPGAAPRAIERRLEVRMQRQAIVKGDDPVRLEAVVDEGALKRVIGSHAIMAAQLRALADLPPNIKLQVIPYDRGAHPGVLGSLVIMKFRDELAPDVALVESVAGHIMVEEGKSVETLQATYRRLQRMALSRKESAALIEAARRDHEKGA